ncbi:MAG: zf-HC2 domain-containing protein [Bacteroidales bacterium]|nr:zf-HC2 domain-containing protein [Bacteroidales bacterium]
MNCLNRIEIQEYLDKEVNPATAEEISRHLERCRECTMLYRQAVADKEFVSGLLNTGEQKDGDAEIPVFRQPEIYRKKMAVYRLIPYILAASLLAFVVLIRHNRTPYSPGITGAEILLNQYYEGKDLNKMWHEKSHVIILQDEKGNFIEPVTY